jgi:site-specific DNA recombinase
MTAAIYSRYSSENQRPESIDDQVSACRRLAKERGLTISEDHIYADQAQSGARSDRPGLAALLAAAPAHDFDVVLVDDLSRLARDNHLVLSIIAELHFEGIRVISVADGLDSTDEESTLAIQVRGIFNELQLRDLKKKTLRGQLGQKERGFFVGEKTFGYRSIAVGELQMDKKGRPRPDRYKMEIEPKEAAIILRIFTSYAGGLPLTKIVRTLNEENVPGAIRSAKGWSPATVSRILDNEKYTGRWIWNRTESRGDPRTGRRRRFEKPESEWVIHKDEELRIVPSELWEKVRERRKQMRRTWPGGDGKRGFSADEGSRQKHFRRTSLPAAWCADHAARRSLRSAARTAGTTVAWLLPRVPARTRCSCAEHWLRRSSLTRSKTSSPTRRSGGSKCLTTKWTRSGGAERGVQDAGSGHA